MPGSRTASVVCSHDCPDSCAILVTIDEAGVATRVQGDPDHSVTRGFLCGKVAKYLDRVYSPSRLLYPMRRRAGAPKGRMPSGHEADAFERISWDEALNLITERLGRIAQEHGPESVLPYSYAGTMGVLGYGSMDRRFFHRLGRLATRPHDLCDGRRRCLHIGLRDKAGHGSGTLPPCPVHHRVGREYPRQ